MRGYNDTIILSLLLTGPSYGYEISKQIKHRSGEKYIMKETTLYSAFTRLEKNALVASFQLDEKTEGRRRTYYQITEKGKEFLAQRRAEWTVTKEVVNQFLNP